MPVDTLSTTAVSVDQLNTDVFGALLCSEGLPCSDHLASGESDGIVTLTAIGA